MTHRRPDHEPAPLRCVPQPRAARVARRVLQDDPLQEYFLYVPRAGGHGAPMCVAVHGIARDARDLTTRLAAQAETYGAVLLAPLFSPQRDGDYQRLGRVGRGRRADLVLDAIVEEVAWITGAMPTPIYLFGYSGGAQFAHRYALAHPQRVARLAVAAAGWYTFPDARLRFPYGVRRSRALPGVRFDLDDFLRVPVAVFVGDSDVESKTLRRSDRVDRQQGQTRVERARNWVASLTAAAEAHGVDSLATLEEIPGGHSFRELVRSGGLASRVFVSLFGPARAAVRNNGNGSP